MSKQWLHDIWWKFIRFELFLAWFVTGWNISTVFTLLIKPLHIAFHLQKNTRVDQGSSITLENFNEHLPGKVNFKRHVTVIENCNYLHIMLAFTIVCIIQVVLKNFSGIVSSPGCLFLPTVVCRQQNIASPSFFFRFSSTDPCISICLSKTSRSQNRSSHLSITQYSLRLVIVFLFWSNVLLFN